MPFGSTKTKEVQISIPQILFKYLLEQSVTYSRLVLES